MASKKIFALIMSLFIGIFALYTVAMYLYASYAYYFKQRAVI